MGLLGVGLVDNQQSIWWGKYEVKQILQSIRASVGSFKRGYMSNY